MDIATIIGLVVGIGLVLGSIIMGGGGLGPFINVPSAMITIGGSFSALLINFPLNAVLGMFGVVKKCFLQKLMKPPEVIELFREMSTVARKDGLLALEGKIAEIDDEFMKRGLEMVVGGTAKEEIESILETEISYIEERHKTGKKVIDSLGAAAPAFGMVGTLIGLVQMLRTLDDPSQIGGGMATALLTTLYGAVIANLFCIPLAGKLEARSKEELMVRDLMVSGMLGLVEGQAPRALHGRLTSFLSPRARPSEENQTAA
jgi:chemotaxis protein MotA